MAHRKILASSISLILGGLMATDASAHPGFWNGGTTYTKCGTTNAAVSNGVSAGTVTQTALTGSSTCGPTLSKGIVDGITIGHGIMNFSGKPEKYQVHNGDKRQYALNSGQIDYYRGAIVGQSILFPSGEALNSSPTCAPASVSSNAPGENYVPGTGSTTANKTFFVPNAKFQSKQLCRPNVARVISYKADGIDIVPSFASTASGATSTTVAQEVSDGWSPTADYSKNGIVFSKGNFGQATTLGDDLVFNGTSSYSYAVSGKITDNGTGNEITDGTPVTSLKGTFLFLGNPYFSINHNVSGADAWYGLKPVRNANPAKLPVNKTYANQTTNPDGSPALEYFKYANYQSASFPGVTPTLFEVHQPNRFRFADSSCARNIVVRPAIVDFGAKSGTLDTIPARPDVDHINTFFGGHTDKFLWGDAGQQNWWANYVLLHREESDASWNTSVCGAAGTTTRAQKAYDVVVMPSKTEIDKYVLMPGFVKTLPNNDDYTNAR